MKPSLRTIAVVLLAAIALGHSVAHLAPSSLPGWWLQAASRTLEGLLAAAGIGVSIALILTRLGLSRPSAILQPSRRVAASFGLVPVLVWCAALATLTGGWGDLALVLPLALALGIEASARALEGRRLWQRGHEGQDSLRNCPSWRTAGAELGEHAEVLAGFVPRALGVHAAVSLLYPAATSLTWSEQLGTGFREGFSLRTGLALLGLWLTCWAVREAVEPIRRFTGFAAQASAGRTHV